MEGDGEAASSGAPESNSVEDFKARNEKITKKIALGKLETMVRLGVVDTAMGDTHADSIPNERLAPGRTVWNWCCKVADVAPPPKEGTNSEKRSGSRKPFTQGAIAKEVDTAGFEEFLRTFKARACRDNPTDAMMVQCGRSRTNEEVLRRLATKEGLVVADRLLAIRYGDWKSRRVHIHKANSVDNTETVLILSLVALSDAVQDNVWVGIPGDTGARLLTDVPLTPESELAQLPHSEMSKVFGWEPLNDEGEKQSFCFLFPWEQAELTMRELLHGLYANSVVDGTVGSGLAGIAANNLGIVYLGFARNDVHKTIVQEKLLKYAVDHLGVVKHPLYVPELFQYLWGLDGTPPAAENVPAFDWSPPEPREGEGNVKRKSSRAAASDQGTSGRDDVVCAEGLGDVSSPEEEDEADIDGEIGDDEVQFAPVTKRSRPC